MSISVIPSSAQITLNNLNAREAVTATADGTKIICNLTNGFNPANHNLSGQAFNARGQVDLKLDNASEVAIVTGGTMRFGFIQIAKMHFSGRFWAGRKTSEGSVAEISSSPPAWPPDKLVSLDSLPGISPFQSTVPPKMDVQQRPGDITVRITDIIMADHPMFGGPVKIKNMTTVTDNFLFNLREHVEYFTVLVLRDARGVTALAHFRWEILYDARVRWSGGQPTARPVGNVTFDTPVQGGPTDPEVNRVLSDPRPPHTNEIAADADRKAVTGGIHSVNFSHNPRHFINVPPDFFT